MTVRKRATGGAARGLVTAWTMTTPAHHFRDKLPAGVFAGMQTATLPLSMLACVTVLHAQISNSTATGQAQTSAWQIRESPQVAVGTYLANFPLDEGKPGFYADMQQGQLRVAAACSSDMLVFQISSTSIPPQKIRVDAQSAAGIMRTYTPITVDGTQKQIFGTLNDNTTALNIEFSNITQTGVNQIGQHATPSMADIVTGGLKILYGTIAASILSAGSLRDAYAARSIEISVPLANGTMPVVEIQPQQDSFLAFRQRCGFALRGTSMPGPKISVALNSNAVLRTPPNGDGPGIRSGAELVAALDNSIWIADGNSNEKQVYVIASPCDATSQAFYKASRKFKDTVQFRWVIMVPAHEQKCVGYLGQSAASDDAGVLDDMYIKVAPPMPVAPNLEENAMRWNTGVEHALSPILKYMDAGRHNGLEYPTLVWLSRDGISASVNPEQIEGIVGSVVARPQGTQVTPLSRALVKSEYQWRQAGKKSYFARTDEVRLYSMPDARSQVTSTMRKDTGFPAARITSVGGEVWIELQTAPQPALPNLFVRQADVYHGKAQ